MSHQLDEPHQLNERVILGPECLREGAAWLAHQEPAFGPVLSQVAPLPLRLRGDGFEALLSAIVSQQVSVASAAALWRRLKAARLTGPRKVLWADEAALRAAGLSRQKARYAKALAEARIDYAALRQLPTEEVIACLVNVPGIGVWTAEIYAMLSLGRADVFAPGDLALQEAARMLFALPERPKERDLRQMAEAWRPWRSVAARALWAYYATQKQREGIG